MAKFESAGPEGHNVDNLVGNDAAPVNAANVHLAMAINTIDVLVRCDVAPMLPNLDGGSALGAFAHVYHGRFLLMSATLANHVRPATSGRRPGP